MKRQNRSGERGFTLMELMVTMAILAVLAGIVVPGVTGTKGSSEGAQLTTDRQGVQTAATRFSSESTTGGWPETAGTGTTAADGIKDYKVAASGGDGTIPLYDTNGTTAIALTTATAVGYRLLDFVATTSVISPNGTTVTVTFVPDFLDRKPASADILSGSDYVYLWMLKQGTLVSGQGQVRNIKIFKLNAAGDKYILQK